MGNRAVITTEKKEIGIYLHWNGGRDSVEGFLTYCKERGFRSPEDDNYGWAALCGVIYNFFGCDGMSLGVDKYENLDTNNVDNGVYVIKNWEIIDRIFNRHGEQTGKDLKKMVDAIKKAQPKKEI